MIAELLVSKHFGVLSFLSNAAISFGFVGDKCAMCIESEK